MVVDSLLSLNDILEKSLKERIKQIYQGFNNLVKYERAERYPIRL